MRLSRVKCDADFTKICQPTLVKKHIAVKLNFSFTNISTPSNTLKTSRISSSAFNLESLRSFKDFNFANGVNKSDKMLNEEQWYYGLWQIVGQEPVFSHSMS